MTAKQYERLCILSPANVAFDRSKTTWQTFVDKGWVTAQDDGERLQWVRITPEGLRALADAVEAYGLPEFPEREA